MAEMLARKPLFNGKTEVDQLDKVFFILLIMLLLFICLPHNLLLLSGRSLLNLCRYLELWALQMIPYGLAYPNCLG